MSLTLFRAGRQLGQALPLLALVLPVLVLLVFGAVELGSRMAQRAELEDALASAVRSAVQAVAYEQLGQDQLALRSADVLAIGQQTLAINLSGVRGLALPPADAAAVAHWTIINDPGSEQCRDVRGEPVPFAAPGVCAELRVPLRSFLGWQPWQSTVFAAVTLDRSR